ncbi:phosphoribosyltransferase-like protein [Methylobacterium goesingense]|uniref:VWFA domain-containing protein n=1 Tax=Methylobacterium goesingense TaxID=243690 RepID=A0ABV2L8P4_9HYPH|nr:hypothetical protein [Methylobacterium goesingense]GJD76519.1 hypothetical protein CFIICLFH_4777 [Methylobacterium goesingense]
MKEIITLTKLSNTEFGSSWLDSRFNAADRRIAASLIDEILLISSSMFAQNINEKISCILEEQTDPGRSVALYAEREVSIISLPDGTKKIEAFWPGTARGRATGHGAPPIIVDPTKQDVGSEGSIANLITNFMRSTEGRILSHPGPDELRNGRTGAIVIVTDLIGSGQRIFQMLEAFRAVATLRSWGSYPKIKYYVVAYSSTHAGLRAVNKSPLHPDVRFVVGCPTVRTVFRGKIFDDIVALCKKFPGKHSSPLGHRNTGALIAFEHGAPNNSPRILHSTARGWIPLFKGRSTVLVGRNFPSSESDMIARRIGRLLGVRDAQNYLGNIKSRQWITTMVVLKSIAGGLHSSQDISSYSGLRLDEVEDVLTRGVDAHWVSTRGALTPLGRRELSRLRDRRRRSPELPFSFRPYYYPTQLRDR